MWLYIFVFVYYLPILTFFLIVASYKVQFWQKKTFFFNLIFIVVVNKMSFIYLNYWQKIFGFTSSKHIRSKRFNWCKKSGISGYLAIWLWDKVAITFLLYILLDIKMGYSIMTSHLITCRTSSSLQNSSHVTRHLFNDEEIALLVYLVSYCQQPVLQFLYIAGWWWCQGTH